MTANEAKYHFLNLTFGTRKLLKYVHSLVYNQSIFKLMAQNE